MSIKQKAPFVSACQVTTHDLKGACASHGVSYRVLYEAVSTSEIPGRQLGVKWLVRCEDIEQWITDNSSPNSAELERGA